MEERYAALFQVTLTWRFLIMSGYTLVDIAIGYGLDSGELGFDSPRGQEIFLLFTASRLAVGPTQHAIKWVPLGVKWQGRETGYLLPSERLKIDAAIPPPPPPAHIFLDGFMLY